MNQTDFFNEKIERDAVTYKSLIHFCYLNAEQHNISNYLLFKNEFYFFTNKEEDLDCADLLQRPIFYRPHH